MITAIRRHIADTLFPKTCLGCDAQETFLCSSCFAAIPRRHEHNCPFCRNRTPFGETCVSCSRHYALDGLFSATSFHGNRVVEETIHAMKYEFVAELSSPLGELLSNAVFHSELPLPDIIIPVPLHPWRLRFRGFNQATLIAHALKKRLAPELDIPVRDDLLRRTRFTLPQARSHKAKERKENLRNAFALSDERASDDPLRHSTVWLVDDVATTGATLEECAKILKKYGTKKVIGIVVAR